MDNSNPVVTPAFPTAIVAAMEDASGLEEDIAGADAPAIPPKRPQGRPKGLGRVPGSGRKKGTANKVTQDVRDYIMDKGKPLELLFLKKKSHREWLLPLPSVPLREEFELVVAS